MNKLEEIPYVAYDEFVPPILALRLKVLGFDDPCFVSYYKHGEISPLYPTPITLADNINSKINPDVYHCTIPTYRQAFKWIRKNFSLMSHVLKGRYPTNYYPVIDDNVSHKYNPSLWFDSYEKAEISSLEILIELIERKSI